ncbi:hypothetical protein Rhopal_007083-T1 [Rhodotorula paludigena]|uniref:Uncharacterized protein n=1 Tax=Rhodotorula paludigena TaxID=86838 RepID=A0AAV5GX11_9BASI|nr:hypothetical protein Rhopal_007083-T1 [Rhodotorula paludigena]
MDGIPVSSAPSDASHAAHPADFLFAHSHHQDHHHHDGDHDQEEQDVHAMLQDALRAYEDNVDPANAAAAAAGHDEQHLRDHGDDTAETDHLALVRAAAMGGAAPATAQTDSTGYGAATAEGAAPSTSATGPPLDGAPPPAAASAVDQDAAADAPTYVDAPAQRPGRGPGSRARWTPQEDQTLVDLVRIDPPLTWTEIGKRMGRPGTGCGMRWYKFLRDKVAAQDEAAGVQTTEGASTGEDAIQEQSEGQTEGAQQLEPSSEMVVGGSGANAAVAAEGGSSSNANGSQTGESASPDPSAPGTSSSAQRRGTRKTITNVQTGRIVDLPYVPPSQLPPALPPSASLPGHPYPRPEGKVHSNAGKGYLPLSAMVAQPPIPFAKNTVLRGRRTKAADVPPPPADAATASDASAVAAAATTTDGASSQSPMAGAASDDAVAAAAAARPKKGKGAKGGLSKAGTSVHKCPAENCEAAFKRSEHLRRHYKSVHRGEKLAGCGKSFSRKDNLQQHQAMVHYVRALYTYPDGNTTTDPPEAGDPSAANVTVTFEQVDIQRTPRGAARKAAGGRSKSKQVAATVAGAKPEDEGGAAEQGDALASENGAEHSQQDGSVQQGAASSSRAGALPPLFGTAAAAYSTAPSASMSPHGAGARDTSLAPSSGAASVDGNHNGGGVAAGGAGTQLGDLYAPDGPGSRGQKRARSAASGSGAGAVAADEDDGEGHGAGAIDKRLRLTGLDLDAHGVDHLDPALQVLAAQAQQHPQGHAAHVLAQAQAALLSQHQHHLQQQQQQQQGAGGAGEPARSITPSQGAFNAQPQLINALAKQLQLQQQQHQQQQDGAAGGDMLVDAPLDHLADGLYVPGLAAYLSENGRVGGADGGPA